MGNNPRIKWYLIALCLFFVCIAGLLFGKSKERQTLSALYERRDFTLLDDQNEFFRLNTSLPARKLALLVFTPDGIPTDTVKEFYEFAGHIDDLRAQGLEPILVTRVSRDIVGNFKRASHFSGRVLLDAGGSVSRNAGVWDGGAITAWAYVLSDNTFHILWQATSDRPMSYERLAMELKKAK